MFCTCLSRKKQKYFLEGLRKDEGKEGRKGDALQITLNSPGNKVNRWIEGGGGGEVWKEKEKTPRGRGENAKINTAKEKL